MWTPAKKNPIHLADRQANLRSSIGEGIGRDDDDVVLDDVDMPDMPTKDAPETVSLHGLD